MTLRTLVAFLAVAAMSCAIASGQVVVKTGDASVSVSVSSSAGSPPNRSGGGWLGVRISPVPPALAAHLKSKNAGAMVANLVKGSPAHKAGVKQYDVIVGLDDRAIKDGPGLIQAVSGRKAGDKVKLWVMRKGEKTQIALALGKPMPVDKVELLHKESFPGALNIQRDITRLHPHVMLRKGKDGGDWEKMAGKDLPEEIRKMLKSLPQRIAPGANGNVSVSAKTVIHTKDSNGSDVRIEQDETGKITVQRKQRDDDGNEAAETKTYKNREELRLSDPDAFDLFKKSNVKVFTSIKRGPAGKGLKAGDMPEIRLFAGGAKLDAAKLRKEIIEQLLKSFEKMNLPDDVKKQLGEQLQIEIEIERHDVDTDTDTDKDEKPKAPKKNRKDKTPRNPRKPKE